MKTAICVIIKDENDYLDEWLNWHLNLGIDEIFLYEDYNSMSHSHITKPYGNRVHLNSIDIIFNPPNINTMEQIQVQLFRYFFNMYKDEFDWILFNDLDEFLILKQPLHKLLEEYDNKPGILLRWKWYGASGHINKPKGNVVDNFTKHTSTLGQVKSFINSKNFVGWKHYVHEIYGAVFPLTDWGGHKAWLNHYFTKSWEEWKTKILDRGDVCPNNRKIEEFFLYNTDMLPFKEQLLSEVTERYKNEKKTKGEV